MQVIPYLTVYAVLPSSLLFLLVYSIASQHMTRAKLFDMIVGVFMLFFALFGLVLYPNHNMLHPHAAADALSQVSNPPLWMSIPGSDRVVAG